MKHDFFDTISRLYTNSPAFREQVVVLMVGKVQALGSTPLTSSVSLDKWLPVFGPQAPHPITEHGLVFKSS